VLQTYLKEKRDLKRSNPKEFAARKEEWQRKREQQLKAEVGVPMAGVQKRGSINTRQPGRTGSLGNPPTHRTNPLAGPPLHSPAVLTPSGPHPPPHPPQPLKRTPPQPPAGPHPSLPGRQGASEGFVRRGGPSGGSGSLRPDDYAGGFRRALPHNRPGADAPMSQSSSGSEHPSQVLVRGSAGAASRAVAMPKAVVPKIYPTPPAGPSLKRMRPSGGVATPSPHSRERPR
jgi:hypothetical protein